MAIVSVGMLSTLGIAEWWQVRHRNDLRPLMDPIPVACEPYDENNDKIVHIDCPLRRIQTLYPAATFSWNVSPYVGVFLETKVEMYQWKAVPGRLGIWFTGSWSPSHETRSLPFVFSNAHRNPDYWPHIPGQGRKFSDTVYVGNFAINSTHLKDFRNMEQLPLQDDGYYAASAERPPVQVTGYNTHVVDDALYTGSAEDPVVGDIRIKFYGSTASHGSGIGRQVKRKGRYYLESLEEDRVIRGIVREGDFSANELIGHVLRERDGPGWRVWLLRLFTLGWVGAFVALSSMFVDVDSRLSALGVVLGALGASVFTTFGVAGPLWCLYSPVIGGILVAAAVTGGLLAVVFWSSKQAGPRYQRLELASNFKQDLIQAPIGTAPIRTPEGTYVLHPI
ncbi:MAG: hypothetical protein KVP17_001481 [Porospora cf. gigantea B]|nr:MAG: hypothetical protein KVP17_001481 [Porospora cf. gigantea B]